MGRTGWSIHAAPNGKAYWHSEQTGESVWVEPVEVVRYRLETEVDGWGVHPAPNGKPYWHNEDTGASVWMEPPAMMERRKAYMRSMQGVSFARIDQDAAVEGKHSDASGRDAAINTGKKKKKKSKDRKQNNSTRDEGKSADITDEYKLSDTSDDDGDSDDDIIGALNREMKSTLQGYLTTPSAGASTNASESKSSGDGGGDMGKRIDGWEERALTSEDPSEMKRVLRETMAALKNSLSDVHDITTDRDALVEAIHKMSAENHEEVTSLEAEIQSAKAKIKRLKKKVKRGGTNTSNGDNDGDGGKPDVAALQDGLEAALQKLQVETDRSRALERSLAQLKDENEALRAQLAETSRGDDGGRDRGRAKGSRRHGGQEGKTSEEAGEVGESKAGSRPGRVSGSKKKKSKRSKRPKRSKQDNVQRKNMEEGGGSLIEDHIQMGRSASVVQSHMRGFLARREMRQRIETKLDEDIDIPDFGFLDDLEPMSPMLQRGIGSDRKSLRK